MHAWDLNIIIFDWHMYMSIGLTSSLFLYFPIQLTDTRKSLFQFVSHFLYTYVYVNIQPEICIYRYASISVIYTATLYGKRPIIN
jgi:hypothetical protein